MRRRQTLTWLVACMAARALEASAADSLAWQFLEKYPRQYLVQHLKAGEAITLDGKLDDAAWEAVDDCPGDFVDITNHFSNSTENAVPDWLQTKVKLRWDSEYLYVGAELRDPMIFGNISGHNRVAPYHDNDFEVFIDVSGSTEYYKEYEMNAVGATYDVLWGVPDGDGLRCTTSHDPAKGGDPTVPICVNTSFPGYAGSWTMAPALQAATSYNPADFGRFRYPYTTWTLEIAFPIHATASHGGLLSGDEQTDLNAFDPNRGPAGPNRPRYWWIDFARAEHPREYTAPSGEYRLCPLDCGRDIEGYKLNRSYLNASMCVTAQKRFPTLLGTDPTYGCYWEWVWMSLGAEAYMHRPLQWGLLQFDTPPTDAMPSTSTPTCKNIEWPGRHLVHQIFLAQRQYLLATGNTTYATELSSLSDAKYCNGGCDADALHTALITPAVFAVDITVTANATKLSRKCTARPCYSAAVTVSAPTLGGTPPYVYTVAINENMRVETTHAHPTATAPCLGEH
eukprot:m.1639248 g.1639248  ORF g.1639248 m.1639248 type:complete len:510 (-) comp34160_c0_seq1:168-1697(-)